MKRYINRLTWTAMLSIISAVFPMVSRADSPNDILVIVNKSLPVDNLSIDEIKQIFLKTKSSWPGGERIVCIHAQGSSDIRAKFRSTVLSMTGPQEEIYWADQRLRYQLTAPAEMMGIPRAIFKLKNAIGYAYRKDVPKDVVKIVLVIPQ